VNEFYLCILDEFRLLGYNKNVEPDGCHNRINEHEVEAMPQNSASHLVATDGSLFLFGLFLGSLKIHIYNVYIHFTMHGNQHCLHKYAPQRAAQKRCLTTAFI